MDVFLIRKMASDAAAWFLDTSYLLALINTRDQWSEVAAQWERRIAASYQPLLTTEYVLIELADGLASVRFRSDASATVAILRSSSLVEIIPASSSLFDAGLDLYVRRQDKDWGLTDCISFTVMRELGLYYALSADEHFRQAGYRPLLLES